MKNVIFSSTGRTGKHLVQKTLEHGQETVAYARQLVALLVKNGYICLLV